MTSPLKVDVAQLHRKLPHLPTIRHSRLWHIGSLSPADKGIDGPSQEGSGLSVSWCPESWLEIACLGGRPRWRLARADKRPGRFVAFHRLSDAERATLAEILISLGLLALKRRYRVSYYDEESDDNRHFLETSRRRASAEARFNEGEFLAVRTLVATKRLRDLAMQHVHDLEAFELAVTVLVDHWPYYDGVWWSDDHDVKRLSAPRGAISRSMVGNWTPIQP